MIMDQGRIAAEGSPRALVERYCTREVVELRYPSAEAQQAALPRLEQLTAELGASIDPLIDRVLVHTDHGDDVVGRIATADSTHDSVLVRRSTLEDVFLRLTGRQLAD